MHARTHFLLLLEGEALTDAECEQMIKEVDADGSGTIELHEFAAMMGGQS